VAAEASAADPQGHYTALGVPYTATAEAIRRAYKQRVLQAHPDKGGSAEAFRMVTEAFNLLSDCEKRAEYDGRPLDEKEELAEPPDQEQQRVDGEGVAKAAYADLLSSPQPAWGRLLARLSVETLEAAARLLQGYRAGQVKRGSKRKEPAQNEDMDEEKTKGLWKNMSGTWGVKVTWRNFNVCSGVAIPTMEQAVAIHVALTKVRNIAQKRFRALCETLANIGCPPQEVEECPPLLQSELLEIFRDEPFPLHFATDLTRRGARIMTPWTPSLAVTLEHRTIIQRVLAKSGFEREHCKVKAKRLMQEQAKQNREAGAAALSACLVAVRTELEGRPRSAVAAAPPLRKRQAPAPLAVAAPEPVLALKDVAAAAELEVLQIKLKAQQEEASHWRATAAKEGQEVVNLRGENSKLSDRLGQVFDKNQEYAVKVDLVTEQNRQLEDALLSETKLRERSEKQLQQQQQRHVPQPVVFAPPRSGLSRQASYQDYMEEAARANNRELGGKARAWKTAKE